MQIGVEADRAVDNKRVFVLDTDEITRMAAVFMLHDENETHEFGSVAAVLDKAKDWKPDLIILGEAIVQSEGMGIFKQLSGSISDVKTLLMTPPNEDFVAKCRESGLSGVAFKPLTVEKLRDRVDAMLGRKRRGIAIQAL